MLAVASELDAKLVRTVGSMAQFQPSARVAVRNQWPLVTHLTQDHATSRYVRANQVTRLADPWSTGVGATCSDPVLRNSGHLAVRTMVAR
jgi:hypothetical protein